MTTQDIQGWFVTLLAIFVIILAVVLPIVTYMTRKSARTSDIHPNTPDYSALPGCKTHADDHGHGHGGDGN